MEVNKIGVHRTHCCVSHGCKYGDDDCPVVNKQVVQAYLCETCKDSGISSLAELTRQNKLEVSGAMKIEIGVDPDEEMAKQGTPFSWCLMRFAEPTDSWDYTQWKIIGSGWSDTHHQAYLDACQAIEQFKQKSQSEPPVSGN